MRDDLRVVPFFVTRDRARSSIKSFGAPVALDVLVFSYRPCFCTIAFALLLVADSIAAPKRSSELVDGLERALRDEAASKPAVQDERMRATEGILDSIRANIRHGNQISTGSIETILATTTSDRVRRLCRDLLAEIQKERDAREATFLPEANLAVNRTSELVLAAKVPKDLDALLKTLSDLKQRREDVTSDVGKRAFAKVEAAFSVVTHWQDYLANFNAGNMKAAHEALRPIAEAVTYPVIPRSEILTRMTQLEPPPPKKADPAAVEAILKKMQTLEDIGPTLLELNKIGFGSGDDRAGYELYRSLKKLDELYKDFRGGLPVVFTLHDPTSDQSHAALSAMWGQFLLLTAPRYLGTTDRPPQPDESLTAYLERIRNQAKNESNLDVLSRVLDIYHLIDPSNSARMWGDIGAVRTCIIGKNQEDAGEYSSAVLSYESSLKNPGDNTPVKFIREHLDAIKSQHRKEYDEGLQRSRKGETPNFNPPSTTSFPPPVLTVPGSSPPLASPSPTPFWSLQPGITPSSPVPLNLLPTPTATPKPPLRRTPAPFSRE